MNTNTNVSCISRTDSEKIFEEDVEEVFSKRYDDVEQTLSPVPELLLGVRSLEMNQSLRRYWAGYVVYGWMIEDIESSPESYPPPVIALIHGHSQMCLTKLLILLWQQRDTLRFEEADFVRAKQIAVYAGWKLFLFDNEDSPLLSPYPSACKKLH